MNAHAYVQHSLSRHNSWLGLTLEEVAKHLGNSGKPLGSMNVDELLKNVWAIQASQSSGIDNINPSPEASLQRQASWSLARSFTGKTVDEVWRDIERGCRTRKLEEVTTLGETTLEDFLVKAGMYVNKVTTIEPVMSLDSALKSHKILSQMRLSPCNSIDDLSDTPTPPGRKRGPGDLDKTMERRLRRKIKNRESAARSRARKQAYHNELVTKVTWLEEENSKLKKEKEFEQMVSDDDSTTRYQLRRTSSF